MNVMRIGSALTIATTSLFGFTGQSLAGNLLANPGFDVPTPGLSPPTYATSFTGVDAGAASSADAWGLYNNSAGTISSELLASTDPGGGGYIISVSTPGPADGIYQFFANPMGVMTESVDVFVLRGVVDLEFWKDNGNTLLGSVASTMANQWETLTLNMTIGTPNEFVLYAGGGSPAIFYADNAIVPSSVPEPSSLLLLLLGALVPASVGIHRSLARGHRWSFQARTAEPASA